MGEFVHVYNDGGGIRDVYVADGIRELAGGKNSSPGVAESMVFSIGIPFCIPAGDGATNGLSFNNSAGSFTMSATIIANCSGVLKGCYCWMPANFGGSSYPAGWYWATFSNDTNGILYMDKYVSGVPQRVASPTPFPVNLTGRINQTASEITGPTGFTIAGGSMGPNGILKAHIRTMGSTTNTKTYKAYLDAVNIFGISPGASPITEYIVSCANQGVENQQLVSPNNSVTGVGYASATFSATNAVSVDTSVNRNLSFSLQPSANTVSIVLLRADVTVGYGA